MKNAWIVSIGIHMLLAVSVGFFGFYFQSGKPLRTQNIEFEVMELEKPTEAPVVESKPTVVDLEVKKQVPLEEKNVERVFGLNEDALQDGSSDVAVKAGNTLTKEEDDLEYKGGALLPTPVAEYLVTQMPVLVKEVKPAYPQDAKNKGITGRVVLQVLVDEEGRVRRADVLEDPGYGFGDEAQKALVQYVFQPAKLENKNVAVEIRYVVAFDLY